MTFTHSLAWLVIALSLIGAIRWSWNQSRPIGVLILAGVMLRAIAGLALFWISFRHLPIMQSLQLGNGFWVLAPDGVSYYSSARLAVEHGLTTISPTSPSPVYIELLAIALQIFGESPLTAVFLNIAAYTLSCVLCMSMWPRYPKDNARGARAVAIGALSLSPSLVLVSTQPLKDQVFALFIVMAVACVRTGLGVATTPASRKVLRGLFAVAGAAAAVYALGGMRAYYALLVGLATTAVMTALTASLPLRQWTAHLAGTAAVTAVLWIAFVEGAGPYAEPYRDLVFDTLHISYAASGIEATGDALEIAREGFMNAGGATNIVRHRGTAGGAIDKLQDEVWGLMVVLVPISLMRALFIYFSGWVGVFFFFSSADKFFFFF